MTDERLLQIGLAVLVLEVQELQEIRIFDFLFHESPVSGLGSAYLGTEFLTVLRSQRTFKELRADLSVELPDGPASANSLRFIEGACLVIPYGHQPHILGPGKGKNDCLLAARKKVGRSG